MKSSQINSNISIEYKNDEEAKQRFVNYLVDLLLEDFMEDPGGDYSNSYESKS